MENNEHSMIEEEEYMPKPTSTRVIAIIGLVLGVLSVLGNIYFMTQYASDWRMFYAVGASGALAVSCAVIAFSQNRGACITAFGVFSGIIALTFILNMVMRKSGGVMSIIGSIILLVLFSAIKPSREYLTSKAEKEKLAREKAEQEAKKAEKAARKAEKNSANDSDNPMFK